MLESDCIDGEVHVRRDFVNRCVSTLKGMKMKDLQVPEFSTYEEEADFWDNLDTADFMEDDGKWFRFETPHKRAIRIAILPEVVEELSQKAHAQGVSIETLVNTLLINHIRESTLTN